MYGWRARIGLVLPSKNTVMEADLNRIVPEGLSIHTSRMRIHEEEVGQIEAMRLMNEQIPDVVSLVADAQPDVIIYGCTSGSFFGGLGYDKKLVKIIEDAVGMPAVTTTTACVEALEALGLKTLVVATPYIKAVNDRLHKFLTDSGFKVADLKGLEQVDVFMHGRNLMCDSISLVGDMLKRQPKVDGVFISCTNFSGAINAIDKIEKDYALPVVTANQASAWAALRIAGINDVIQNFGKLFTLR